MERRLTIEEVAAKLKPVFGKKIDEIYLRYAMADSREEKEEIESILNALYHKYLSKLLTKKVLLEPPTAEEVMGEYPLGKVSYADKKLYDFSLRARDWPRHVCVTGMSGSGKTTFAFHILDNFIKKNKPFLVFDWKKSFRPIVLEDSEIMDFTIGNDAVSNMFKMNINEPPTDVDPREWINVLCDLLTESFMVSFGVHKVLLETLDEAFKEWGIYQGSLNYPTWNHIKWRLEQKMAKAGGREGTWLESALRIASVLTFGNFGKVCNYKGEDSMTVNQLLDKKVIFELNALGNVEKKFFCEFVLTYIFKLKKANQNAVSGDFNHAILVDEAHNIFLKEKTHFVNESVTDMVYREMREYGTSLICLDQHISKLSDTVKGNSACHIAFQQQLPEDIRDISGIMQLTDKKEYFSKLPVGSAIVKLAERYNNPFLIEVEPVELRKDNVKNSEITSRMQMISMQRDIEAGKDDDFLDEMKKESLEVSSVEDKPDIDGIQEEIVKKREELAQEAQEKFEQLKKVERWPEDGKEKADFIVPHHANYGGELEEAKHRNIQEGKRLAEKNKIKKKVMPIFFPTGLTSVQERLLEFVEQQLAIGKSMAQVERIMEHYPNEGLYTLEDVSKVINYVLASRFNRIQLETEIPEAEEMGKELLEVVETGIPEQDIVTTVKEQKKQKIYKDKTPLKSSKRRLKDTTNEQEKFIDFLQVNPEHDLSSVALYKKLELSARKGTRVKDELLSQNKIKIIEEKSKKGWKKIIRLR